MYTYTHIHTYIYIRVFTSGGGGSSQYKTTTTSRNGGSIVAGRSGRLRAGTREKLAFGSFPANAAVSVAGGGGGGGSGSGNGGGGGSCAATHSIIQLRRYRRRTVGFRNERRRHSENNGHSETTEDDGGQISLCVYYVRVRRYTRITHSYTLCVHVRIYYYRTRSPWWLTSFRRRRVRESVAGGGRGGNGWTSFRKVRPEIIFSIVLGFRVFFVFFFFIISFLFLLFSHIPLRSFYNIFRNKGFPQTTNTMPSVD